MDVFSSGALGATVEIMDIFSPSMNETFKAVAVVPNAYKSQQHAYPVLYLLHGGGGDYRDWLTMTPDSTLLLRLAAQHKLIIVLADGGPFSYYFDSPLDKTSQVETFFSRELIAIIDEKYRTVRDRTGRLIAGVSMGGHGAMFIASRHPDLYAAVGSISGVMDINTATWKVGVEFAQSRNANFVRLLGPPQVGDAPYPGYSIVTLAETLKANGLPLVFSIGVDDFLIKTNRDLHQRLLANGTPHDYIERPGGHEWTCFGNSLPYHMLFFSDVLKANKVKVP